MKEIEIKNIKQLNTNLFLYKSILYKNVRFITSSDDESIRSTISALNIKNRYKRLEYIYDYCCNSIDKFYDGKNICGFSNGKCLNQQRPGCKLYDGCCRLCIHQNGNGCETKNISCKFFFCDEVKSKNKILKKSDFNILKLLSLRQHLMINSNYFCTREEILRDLYIESVFVFGIRMAYRVIRDFLLFGNKIRKRNKNRGEFFNK